MMKKGMLIGLVAGVCSIVGLMGCGGEKVISMETTMDSTISAETFVENNIPEENIVEETTVEETTTVPETEPVDDSWKELYLQMMSENMELTYSMDTYMAYSFVESDLVEISAEDAGGLYWITQVALADVTFDGVPELILNTGEVEYEMFIFTVMDGKVVLCGRGLSGNQDYEEAAVCYTNTKTGEQSYFSESMTGTGAGSVYRFEQILPDGSLKGLRSYMDDYDMEAETYRPMYHKINEQDVSEEEYQAAVEAFEAEWDRGEGVEFVDLNDDPAAMLASWIAEY